MSETGEQYKKNVELQLHIPAVQHKQLLLSVLVYHVQSGHDGGEGVHLAAVLTSVVVTVMKTVKRINLIYPLK